jgi:hypothetical protein
MKLEIVKRNKLGRQYMAKKDQEALVSEFQKSSLSMKRFCEEEGINAHSFKNWYYARLKGRKNVQFAEVVCESRNKDRKVEIILENRIKVQMDIGNSQELINLIRELKTC